MIRPRQDEVRAGRVNTFGAVTASLDDEGVSRMLSEVASRSVLISAATWRRENRCSISSARSCR
jgi:hypothetical protein